MTAPQLLSACRGVDMVLRSNGDRLEIDTPEGSVTAEIRNMLAEHKLELLTLLRPEYVLLGGRLALPMDVVRVLCSLEDRGFGIGIDEIDKVKVDPVALLTADDVTQLHRWRRHLPALVRYCVAQPELDRRHEGGNQADPPHPDLRLVTSNRVTLY